MTVERTVWQGELKVDVVRPYHLVPGGNHRFAIGDEIIQQTRIDRADGGLDASKG